MQSFECRLGYLAGIRWHGFSRHRQITDNFTLTLAGNFAITQKGCQNRFITEVLPSRLEMFPSLAYFLVNFDMGVSEAVRVEIRQAGCNERITKYFAKERCRDPLKLRQEIQNTF